MAKISERSIEKIRSVADIHEIVSSYVELKKRGRNFFGLCPFHREKTPSFSVNPEKQIYKCFGCGKGGSSIDFIMEVEKLDFVEAIRYLSEQYSIDIEISGSNNQQKDLRSELYEINNHASSLFQTNLFDISNKQILSHLIERGFSKEIIKTFGLGLSPNKKDEVLKLIQQKKYNSKSMLSSGLFIDTKTGYMDRFRNRIMFTIYSSTGKLVGFAGRAIDKNEIAKYMNSPETQIYNKSKILYGLHITKNDISTHDSVIVVEGYFDFLQLFQAGIKNVVAVSGTSLTDGHAHIIKRLTKNVLIAYDGDDAGKSAAIRAGYLLLKNGLNPSIVKIQDGKDPDSWILDSGSEPFLKSIQNAIPLISFSYDNFKKESSSDIVSFINDTLAEFSNISDHVIAEIYLKKLSEITEISFDSIKRNFENIIKKRDMREHYYKEKSYANSSAGVSIEEDVLMLCFSSDKEIREQIYNNINTDWITDGSLKRIYNEIYIHLNSKYEPQSDIILDQLEIKEDHSKLADLLFKFDKIKPTVDMATNCIKRLHHNYLKKEMENLRETLKNAEDGFIDSTDLINKIAKIQQEINTIKGA